MAIAGCGSPAPLPTPEVGGPEKTVEKNEKSGGTVATRSSRTPRTSGEDVWFASYLAGAKLGHLHLSRKPVSQRGKEFSEWTMDMQLSIARKDETSVVRIRFVSRETPEGKLLGFEGEQPFGPSRLNVRGEVTGRELQLETVGGNRVDRTRIAWRDGVGGFHAIEQSLAAKPLEAGEKRSLEKLEPIVFQIVPVTLEAKSIESTRLLNGPRDLLRVETVTTLPGGVQQQQTLWCDPQGQIHKVHSAADRTEAFRCTEEEAKQPGSGPRIDLWFDANIALKAPIAGAHEAALLRYKVKLPDADPREIFPAGGAQHVEKLEPHVARVSVCRLRPGEAAPEGFGGAEPAPTQADRGANPFLQIDDPRVQELARSAAPDETDAWKTAIALEKFVREGMQHDFSQAFSTAADVARTLRGDCTECAVLLAALCRVRGIPARVVVGLVYIENTKPGADQPQPAFGFHMWNEVYIDDRWIPIDGTLGRGGIGAAHVKIAHTSLSEGASLVSFLPVARVLGRLEIEVDEPAAAK